jgi:hypothetical protein
MANWWRNTLLILHYPTVICKVLTKYLETVLIFINELIPDIEKELQTQRMHTVQFSCTKESNLTKRKTKIYKTLIRPVTKYGAECWTLM